MIRMGQKAGSDGNAEAVVASGVGFQPAKPVVLSGVGFQPAKAVVSSQDPCVKGLTRPKRNPN